ncbi:MAG: SCO family protein [Verrucomicrobia bacterium]|nr:SCO family protein [Verrucomicrobiota bacterium]
MARSAFRGVWVGLVLIALTLGAIFLAWRVQQIEVESTALPIYSKVADFTLTNQINKVVTMEDLRGKIWIADIIFTRCAGPCPQMTRNMRALQDALDGDGSVMFISLTTDPGFDTPEVLERYGKKFDVDPDEWWLLTGSKVEIARLAVDGLKLTAIQKEAGQQEDPNDLFIHSTLFVVVDQQGRLRAAIEGMEPQAEQKTVEAVRKLQMESGL